jgi:hypothetical protein
VVKLGCGEVVCAMLSAAGNSSASVAVAAARQAALLSLRTAMHDIGFEAGRSTDSAEVPPGPPGGRSAASRSSGCRGPPRQRLRWPAAQRLRWTTL